MRKEDVASLFVYLIIIAGAIIAGSTVVNDIFSRANVASLMDPVAFAVLSLLIAIILNAILLEVFHALGAKLGGYNIESFNVFGFCYEKRNNKWSFKFSDFNGFTGEVKISPKNGKASLKPFVWLPLLGYLVELITGILIISLQQESSTGVGWLSGGAILFIIVSSMIAIYNLVPLKLDSMTDGYRLLLISKKENIEAFNELMRVESLQRNGKKVEQIKTFETVNNFTVNINLLTVYNLINEKKFSEADTYLDSMINKQSQMDQNLFNRLMAQKLYVVVMSKENDEAQKFYKEKFNDTLRRFIANDDEVESLRAYLVVAGLLEESESEVILLNSKFNKAIKNTLPARADMEKVLFADALDKIYQKHENWDKEQLNKNKKN